MTSTRRHLLHGIAAAAASGVLSSRARAALLPTPPQTEGPFYPPKLPLDSDNDLVPVKGELHAALGTVTHVMGRLLDRNGRPVAGARIEIWQCDANGRYLHPRDSSGRPRDEGFQGYGQTLTATDGSYRFRTIRPVPYPGRTPHIHFAISGRSFDKLVTQMYVAGDPRNATDMIYNAIDVTARDRVTVLLIAAPDIEVNALKGNFDIVLDAAV
jgi:protocatechuate 3,4-dioxygenase, beta subunit